MANSARARSTCAAGALSERLKRVSSWRSSAVSGRRGSFRWRDMGHLGARGSPHHYTRAHGRRPTRGYSKGKASSEGSWWARPGGTNQAAPATPVPLYAHHCSPAKINSARDFGTGVLTSEIG